MSAVVFAPMLALSSILASLLAGQARAAARDYLRFAAVLYLALAASIEAGFLLSAETAAIFLTAVTQVVAATAPVSLALGLFAAFEKPAPWAAATGLLVFACIAGIAAAAIDMPGIAYALLMASACFMLVLGLRRLRRDKRSATHALVAVCALICAAAGAQTKGAGATVALFLSASVIGFALALTRSRRAVAKKRDLRALSVTVSRTR